MTHFHAHDRVGNLAGHQTIYGNLHINQLVYFLFIARQQSDTLSEHRQGSSNDSDLNSCLQNLMVTNPEIDKAALLRRKGVRAKGTCEWFLDVDVFKAWLSTEQDPQQIPFPVLWLHGTPGKGKSTLSLFLVDEMEKCVASSHGKQALTYFFCDVASEERKTAVSVLQGLLFQLCNRRRDLGRYLLPLCLSNGAALFQSFDALWDVLVKIGADETLDAIYCVIDALDECHRDSQTIFLQQLQQTFAKHGSEGLVSKLRFLVTSRPYEHIREYLEDFPNKDLASFPHSKSDVEIFIAERVAYLAKRKHYTAKIEHEVERIMKNKAEGTFLWVGLAYEELLNVASKDTLKLLATLPPGLHSIYQRQLDQALQEPGSNRDDIIRILSLVMIALEPLSLAQLCVACPLHADQDDEERIQFTRESIVTCRLMVVVHDNVVHLLHKSVRDFLETCNYDTLFQQTTAHALFANQCIDVVLRSLEDGKEQMPVKEDLIYPFWKYARNNWDTHARLAENAFKPNDLHADLFAPRSQIRQKWLESFKTTSREDMIYSRSSIFHAAAYWNIPSLIDHGFLGDHLEEHAGKTSALRTKLERLSRLTDSRYDTVLEVAAELGHPCIIERVLDYVEGAAAEWTKMFSRKDERENTGRTVRQALWKTLITPQVLSAATTAESDCGKLISLLLDHGDHLTVTEEIVRQALEGREGLEILSILLSRRGHQFRITEEMLIAVAWSCEHEMEKLTLLLDQREDQIVITENILLAFAMNPYCCTTVMELLLDRRGDEFVVTENILVLVAGNFSCGTTAMKLLLDRRADEVVVTEDILCNVLNNVLCGKETLLLFLDRRRAQVGLVITEHVLMGIAKSENPHIEDMMELLLDQFKDRFLMTREAVMANPLPGSEIHEQARAWILHQELGDERRQASAVEEVTGPILITKEVIEVVREKDLSWVGELELPLIGKRVCRSTRVTSDAAWFEELLLARLGDRVAAKGEQGHVDAYRLTRRFHDGQGPPKRSRREGPPSKKWREMEEEQSQSVARDEVQVYFL